MIENVSFGNTVAIPCKTNERAGELQKDVVQILQQQSKIPASINRGTIMNGNLLQDSVLITTANDLDESVLLKDLAKKYPELNPEKNFQELYGDKIKALNVTI